jgi:hypothetical protein
VGSHLQNLNLAYIAGFLDGDGSLMLQVKKRHDTTSGWRIMATICFYQDNRHNHPLYWIKNQLKIGYISKRNDGITELRINGFSQVKEILIKLLPFIRFKKKQTKKMIKILNLLESKKIKNFTRHDYLNLISSLLTIQNYNYQAPRKKTRQDFKKILGLTP